MPERHVANEPRHDHRPAGPPAGRGIADGSGHWALALQRTAGNAAVTSLVVQRREVEQSAMGRAWRRILGTTPQLPPQDWFYLDRVHWEDAYPDHNLSPFVRACIYNTVNHRPQEYETILQRHEYYRVMSWALQNGPGLPASVRAIRFFDATAQVTDSPGIGTLEAPAGLLVSSEARQVLVEVNKLLLDVNMQVIARVMASRQLVDPQARTGAPATAMEFDLRMVETEQGRVEQYLTDHAALISQTRSELNDLVNDTRGTLWMDPLHMAWAKAALGLTRLEFTNQTHRMAIGKALVFSMHGRPQAEYTRYIQSGQREYQPASTP